MGATQTDILESWTGRQQGPFFSYCDLQPLLVEPEVQRRLRAIEIEMHIYSMLGQKLSAQDVGQTVTDKGLLEKNKALAPRKDVSGQLNLSWTSLRRGRMRIMGTQVHAGRGRKKYTFQPVCVACRVVRRRGCGSGEGWTLLRVSSGFQT